MQSTMLRLDAFLRRRKAAGPGRLGAGPGRGGAVRGAPVGGPLERRLRRARLAVGCRGLRAGAVPRDPARPARRGARAAAGAPRRRSCGPRWTASPPPRERSRASRSRRPRASRACGRPPPAERCSYRWSPGWTRTTPPPWQSTCARNSGFPTVRARASRRTSSARERSGPRCRTSPRRISPRRSPRASRSCC